MTNNALTPIEQKTVTFYDDELIAVRMSDGTVYVPVRPICDLLGISWTGQAKKLRNDPVLSDVSMIVNLSSQSSDTRGKRRSYDMVCLPIDYLNGWIFGINPNRVNDDIRPALIRYQREVYRVLADAFGRNRVTARPSEIDTSEHPAALAYRNALALVNIARQQFEMEQRFNQRVDSAESRIDTIEAQLGLKGTITDAQAQQISEGVRTIAALLSDRSGRNEYSGVYAELYRRFSITSYKLLPSPKFAEAIGFLRQWWERLTDGQKVPF